MRTMNIILASGTRYLSHCDYKSMKDKLTITHIAMIAPFVLQFNSFLSLNYGRERRRFNYDKEKDPAVQPQPVGEERLAISDSIQFIDHLYSPTLSKVHYGMALYSSRKIKNRLT